MCVEPRPTRKRTTFWVRRRDAPADDRGACTTRAEPLGIELRVGSRRDRRRARRRRRRRRAAARTRRPTARSIDHRALIAKIHARRAPGRDGDRPARADAARPAGRARRRHRDRLGAALRRADGLRRPARGVPVERRTTSAARCRAASSACRATPRARPRSGSRCRPASSTSAARRRRRTSAPRRCCSP